MPERLKVDAQMSIKSYNILVVFHLLLGTLIFLFEPLAKLYFFCVLGFLLLWVIQKGNKNDEVLFAAAYITGFEVLSRMTGAAFTYEFAKYSVIFFLLLGMFYRGIKARSWPYFIYMLLLLPGVLFSVLNLSYEANVGNAIGFNLSGPVALGVAAMYCYHKKMPAQRFQDILFFMLLPIISTAVYIYLYTPSIQDVVTGTESNFATSGGYGPNQVSTLLGLASFILLTRIFTINNRWMNMVDLGLLGLIGYRALVTFSRGGVLTAVICSAIFLFIFFTRANMRVRTNSVPKLIILCGILLGAWVFSSLSTGGLINKRYANQDAAGRADADISTGRIDLLGTELTAFYENPLTGLGIGKAKEYRYEKMGKKSASHNEISRLLSEHGIFGLGALLILALIPLLARISDRSNILMLALLGYWFLTINHTSMRIAVPSMIYGLSLIQFYKVTREKDTVHRKQASR